MGNRAVVIYKSDPTTAIYLHWNGGPETVLALIEDAKQQVTEDRGAVAFVQSAANYTRFDGLSLYIESDVSADVDNGDNGTYYVGEGHTVTRRHVPDHSSKACTADELSPHDREKYDRVLAHCAANREAIVAVSETRNLV